LTSHQVLRLDLGGVANYSLYSSYMALTFYDIPYFLLFFMFTAFSLFLFNHKEGRKLSNNLLGCFFLVMGLNVIDGYLLFRGIYDYTPHLAFWLNGLPALFGPLLFLYTKSVLYQDFELRGKHWWHAALFLFIFLFFFFIYHLKPVDYKLFFLAMSRTYTGIEILVGNLVLIIQVGLYLFFSFSAIRQYKLAAESQFSDVKQKQLSWLCFNLLGYTCIYFLILLYSAARFIIWEGEQKLFASMTFAFFLLVFIMGVLYRALSHSEVFTELNESDEHLKKYAYSNLSDTEKQKYFSQLMDLMEHKRPWLEAKLTIGDLASEMNVNAKTLSQVINEITGSSFFDFVNRRRITAAQHLLLNPTDDKMTISEIMYQVGFNSKSSFNTAFKKYTNLTPKEFRKRNLG
jgi:AraC-like DNA-binding protein